MIARKPLVEVGVAAYQANQPIVFAYIEWIMRNVLGPGEMSMRIPSLLGAFGCAYLLYSSLAYVRGGALIGVAVLAVGAVLLAVNLRHRSLSLKRS